MGLTPVILVSVDDSLGKEDRAMRHLEVVDSHYHHAEGSRKKPTYASGYVSMWKCTFRSGRTDAARPAGRSQALHPPARGLETRAEIDTAPRPETVRVGDPPSGVEYFL